jgi:hypothetical protein
MVLLLAVVVGLACGLALGGRPGRLADLQLRGIPIFMIVVGCQLVIFPTGLFPWSIPDIVATVVAFATYGLLTVLAVLNRTIRGFPTAAVGMLCNLIAIGANGGHMPALPSAMRAAGLAYSGVHNNSVADAHPNVAWLVDRFGAPGWVPLANVYSVGDVLLALGTIVLVASAMGARVPRLGAPRREVPNT